MKGRHSKVCCSIWLVLTGSSVLTRAGVSQNGLALHLSAAVCASRSMSDIL